MAEMIALAEGNTLLWVRDMFLYNSVLRQDNFSLAIRRPRHRLKGNR